MKSSERKRRSLPNIAHAALGVAALLLIGVARPGLNERFGKLRVTADDYLLPDPNLTLVASLGYRSALADFIFGHVLVSHGLHFQERRLFEHVGEYLDAINLLDPKFRDPYRFADTLLTMQPKSPPLAFYRKARVILERGMKELPNDQELWTTAGQFIAYIGPGRLKDPAEREEYRRAGARYLLHACDLIGSDQNLPFHCLSAAALLSQQGDREAAKHFLQRMLVLSFDPELQAEARRKLERLRDVENEERIELREQVFAQVRMRDGMAFVSPIELDSLGPRADTLACAGPGNADNALCATTWRRLLELVTPQSDATEAASE